MSIGRDWFPEQHEDEIQKLAENLLLQLSDKIWEIYRKNKEEKKL